MPAMRPRAASTTWGSSLPTTAIIGIVCGALGGLLLILFVARAVLRFRLFRPTPAPLPPVQPLAHRRASRAPAEWLEPVSYGRARAKQQQPQHYLGSDAGSAASLVRPHSATETSASASQSGWEHAYDDGDGSALPTPRRPFLEHRPSGSSDGSGSAPPSPGPGTVHYQVPLSGAASATSHERRGRASRTPSAHSSANSRSRSRGAPHSRRNTMHIVLPAPLAPQLAGWATPPPEVAPSPVLAGSPSSPTQPLASDSWIHRRVRSSASRERMDSSGRRPFPVYACI
jgi:hypothetical protein